MDPPTTICVSFLLPLKISDIESRIAALSAAGLTVKPVEKAKKKSSVQVSVEDGGCDVHAPLSCSCCPWVLGRAAWLAEPFPALALLLWQTELSAFSCTPRDTSAFLCPQAARLHSPGPASSSPGESLDDIKVSVCSITGCACGTVLSLDTTRVSRGLPSKQWPQWRPLPSHPFPTAVCSPSLAGNAWTAEVQEEVQQPPGNHW